MQSDTALSLMKNTFPLKAPFSPSLGGGQPEGVWLGLSQPCSVHKWASLTNVNIHQAKLSWELQGWALCDHPYGCCLCRGGGEMMGKQGKAFEGSCPTAAWCRAKTPACGVGCPHVHGSLLHQGVPQLYRKAAAMGKSFFCASPGKHLPWVPSHCLMRTEFIPLLSLANHALKHVRRVCRTFCISSTYQCQHLSQRHPRIGSTLNFCSTEMYLSEELTFVSNTCSPDFFFFYPAPGLP